MFFFRLAFSCDNHPDSYIFEDFRTGDVICSECGLVVGKVFVEKMKQLFS